MVVRISPVIYPLHYAAKIGDINTVRRCLDEGADVNMAGPKGHTPLFVAADYDKPDIVRLLLDSGAIHGKRTNHGHTPLHVAARNGSVRIVEMLIAAGAAVDVWNKSGVTPLHIATASKNLLAMTTLIIRGGADIDARTKCEDAQLALTIAVDFDQTGELVSALLRLGSSRFLGFSWGRTGHARLVHEAVKSEMRTVGDLPIPKLVHLAANALRITTIK